MASVIWQGSVQSQSLRVVDAGAGNSPRLIVETETGADAMGVRGWTGLDPIPRQVFEGILIAAGVVT